MDIDKLKNHQYISKMQESIDSFIACLEGFAKDELCQQSDANKARSTAWGLLHHMKRAQRDIELLGVKPLNYDERKALMLARRAESSLAYHEYVWRVK